jgi:hypothetical protein
MIGADGGAGFTACGAEAALLFALAAGGWAARRCLPRALSWASQHAAINRVTAVNAKTEKFCAGVMDRFSSPAVNATAVRFVEFTGSISHLNGRYNNRSHTEM